MDMKFYRRNHVISADKYAGSIFERTKCGPTNSAGPNLNSQRLARRAEPMDGWSNGVGQEARSNAGIQRLKSLDYEIHPCISSCGPAFGCSLKLMDSILNITLSVMARRANHRDVMTKSAPGRFSPAKNMPE